MQSLSTLIRISGPITEGKKTCFVWSMIGKILPILGNNQAKQGVGIQVWFAPNTVGYLFLVWSEMTLGMHLPDGG